jgi:hypothetical protein
MSMCWPVADNRFMLTFIYLYIYIYINAFLLSCLALDNDTIDMCWYDVTSDIFDSIIFIIISILLMIKNMTPVALSDLAFGSGHHFFYHVIQCIYIYVYIYMYIYIYIDI